MKHDICLAMMVELYTFDFCSDILELPLVLFDCDFGDDLEWVYEADWHEDNIRHLQQMWAQHAIRSVCLFNMLFVCRYRMNEVLCI